MKLLGFNFTKIYGEKLSSNLSNLKISSKMDIKDINEPKQNFLKTKEEILSISFSFEINYEEGIGKIILEGTLLLALDQKMFREVKKQWKDKQTPEEFRILLFNVVIRKSSVKALELEEELNLPFHMQFPILKKQEKN